MQAKELGKMNADPERLIDCTWGAVYGSLCQHLSYLVEEVTVERKVERIEACCATLWFNSSSRSGAALIPVVQLDDGLIQWL